MFHRPVLQTCKFCVESSFLVPHDLEAHLNSLYCASFKLLGAESLWLEACNDPVQHLMGISFELFSIVILEYINSLKIVSIDPVF